MFVEPEVGLCGQSVLVLLRTSSIGRRHSALGMRTPAEVEAERLRQDYNRGLARVALVERQGIPTCARGRNQKRRTHMVIWASGLMFIERPMS